MIRLGTVAIAAIMLGTTAISKVMLGTEQLWPVGGGVPVLESQTTAQFSTTTMNHSVNKPSGVVAGDLISIKVSFNGSVVLTPPDGFTIAIMEAQSTVVAIMTKIAGNSEPATYDFTTSIARTSNILCCRISGSDGLDVVDHTKISVTNTTHTAPSVNTTKANCLVFRVDGNVALTAVTTPPTQVAVLQGAANSGTYSTLAVSQEDQPVAGASGTADFTLGTSRVGVAVTIAYRPSATKPVPYIVDFTTASSGSAVTSHSCNVPAGNVGDELVFILGKSNVGAASGLPAGWIDRGNYDFGTSGNGRGNIQILTRIADGSEASSYTITTGGAQWSVRTILRIRGGVFDAIAASANPSLECPMVWASEPNDLILRIGGGGNGSSTPYTVPTGTTEVLSLFNGTGTAGGGTGPNGLCVAEQSFSTAGFVVPAAFTRGSSTNRALSISIKPV